ncbi:MAG: fumarate hydratase C-terminal domain-containing protein [Synergistaceae bacterium]|jgi:fumarate hydratase subunit beta|nr:fumarate hydratase C-terminal domain-containing protein [Synergistaceae bacterium]
MRHLNAPLCLEDVEALHAGDIVEISGDIFTSRSGFYRKLIAEGQPFPLDPLENNVMLHSGPIIKKENGWYKVNAISITTSVRFNKWEPSVIERLGLRAIIAKGRVGRETKEAMRRLGCVHLCRTGTFAGAFALKVKEIKSVDWLDLGLPEALWNFRFESFGPLVVETDVYGVSCYDEVGHQISLKINEAYRKLGIEGFEFAEK